MVTLSYSVAFYVHTSAFVWSSKSLLVFSPTSSSSDLANNLAEGSENFQPKEERSYGSIMMERVTGSKDGRVDHSLQVGASMIIFIRL